MVHVAYGRVKTAPAGTVPYPGAVAPCSRTRNTSLNLTWNWQLRAPYPLTQVRFLQELPPATFTLKSGISDPSQALICSLHSQGFICGPLPYVLSGTNALRCVCSAATHSGLKKNPPD